jgi:hypothetical protein
MRVNLSVLDIDVDTQRNTYEVFVFNWFSESSGMDKSLLRVKYDVLRGAELEVFGVRLIK